MSFSRPLAGVFAVFLFCSVRAGAADAGPAWLDDFHQALSQAKAQHRQVLMDFTGSDWCPVCIQMEKEVFNTPTFQQYAAGNLVLMRVDFPVSKTLPPQVAAQNDKLKDEYGIGDFLPAYVLVDKSGKVLERYIGGIPGGPSVFIDFLHGKVPPPIPGSQG